MQVRTVNQLTGGMKWTASASSTEPQDKLQRIAHELLTTGFLPPASTTEECETIESRKHLVERHMQEIFAWRDGIKDTIIVIPCTYLSLDNVIAATLKLEDIENSSEAVVELKELIIEKANLTSSNLRPHFRSIRPHHIETIIEVIAESNYPIRRETEFERRGLRARSHTVNLAHFELTRKYLPEIPLTV